MPIYGGQRVVDLSVLTDTTKMESYLASVTVAIGSAAFYDTGIKSSVGLSATSGASTADSNLKMVAPTASIAHYENIAYQAPVASLFYGAYLDVGPCYLYQVMNGMRQTGLVSVQNGDAQTIMLLELTDMVGSYDFHALYFTDLRFGAGTRNVSAGSGMSFCFRR